MAEFLFVVIGPGTFEYREAYIGGDSGEWLSTGFAAPFLSDARFTP